MVFVPRESASAESILTNAEGVSVEAGKVSRYVLLMV